MSGATTETAGSPREPRPRGADRRLEAAGPVLVPLDGTRAALGALPVAFELARLGRTTPLLLHVGERDEDLRATLVQLGVAPDALAGAVFEVVEGEPAEAIPRVAAERGASLIVLSTCTGPTMLHECLGPVADAVLRAGVCPIVLVRPDTVGDAWRLRAVVLPHDGTPTSAGAIRPTVDLVRRADARLDVLHVAVPGAGPAQSERGTIAAPQYIDQPQYEWPAWASEFLERLHGSVEMPERLNLAVAGGESPGEAIVRHSIARDADLVVTAWRGALDESHAASIRHLLRECRCPVYVVRVSPAEESAERK